MERASKSTAHHFDVHSRAADYGTCYFPMHLVLVRLLLL